MKTTYILIHNEKLVAKDNDLVQLAKRLLGFQIDSKGTIYLNGAEVTNHAYRIGRGVNDWTVERAEGNYVQLTTFHKKIAEAGFRIFRAYPLLED